MYVDLAFIQTWVTGGLGSAELMAGLNVLRVLFHPKRLYDYFKINFKISLTSFHIQ